MNIPAQPHRLLARVRMLRRMRIPLVVLLLLNLALVLRPPLVSLAMRSADSSPPLTRPAVPRPPASTTQEAAAGARTPASVPALAQFGEPATLDEVPSAGEPAADAIFRADPWPRVETAGWWLGRAAATAEREIREWVPLFRLPMGRVTTEDEPFELPLLMLVNPRHTGGAVHLLLDDQRVSLEAGECHRVPGSGPWTIRFHRGADFGDARHAVVPGDYEFQVTARGWILAATAASEATGNNRREQETDFGSVEHEDRPAVQKSAKTR